MGTETRFGRRQPERRRAGIESAHDHGQYLHQARAIGGLMKLRNFVLTTIVVLMGALPGGLSAQPGSQPFVFYGEEPWGGSYLGVDTRDITSDRVSALKLKDE